MPPPPSWRSGRPAGAWRAHGRHRVELVPLFKSFHRTVMFFDTRCIILQTGITPDQPLTAMLQAWAVTAAAVGAAALAAAAIGLAAASRAIEASAGGACSDWSDVDVCEGPSGGGSGDRVSESGNSTDASSPSTPHCAEPAKALLRSARGSVELQDRCGHYCCSLQLCRLCGFLLPATNCSSPFLTAAALPTLLQAHQSRGSHLQVPVPEWRAVACAARRAAWPLRRQAATAGRLGGCDS